MKTDLIYSWWLTSWYPTLLAKISNRKIFVSAGGVGTAYNPDIGYGAFCNKISGIVVNTNVRLIHKILLADISLKNDLKKNTNYHCNNAIQLHGGFKVNLWVPGQKTRDYITCVVVNHTASRSRHLVKGIDRFIKIAYDLPEFKFILVGYDSVLLKKLEKSIPDNLELIYYLPSEKLLEIYQKSKICCQFSRHEALGGTILEANLCGCYTIGSDVGGLPKAVGPSGYIHDFNKDERELLYSAIYNFMSKTQINIEGRKHVMSKFTLHKRKKSLFKLIYDSSELN